MKRDYYKVAIWNWKLNGYHGAWQVVRCSIPKMSDARNLVRDYQREGVLARCSKHSGGDFWYG